MKSITKRCTKCEINKTLDNFHKSAKGKYGLEAYCKDCQKKRLREWVAKNPDKKKEYQHTHYQKHHEDVDARNKKWRSENKEKVRAGKKSWLERNLEKANKFLKKWRIDNKERVREKNQIWRENNRERQREYYRTAYKKDTDKFRERLSISTANRRARKKKSGGKVTAKEWKDLCEKYGNKCLRCGESGMKLTMDHVVPLVLGGIHTIDNIQPLCRSCNSKKHTNIIDYREGI